MKNFWLLVGFEYRKLLKRKSVWIALGIICLLCAFSGSSELFGNYYVEGKKVDSHWNMLKKDQAVSESYEGRKIDQQLLDELAGLDAAGSSQIPDELTAFVIKVTGDDSFDISQEELYSMREKKLEKEWMETFKTEEEKEYLRNLDEKLEQPFTYHYSRGYQTAADLFYTLGMMQTLLTAICIPAIFSEDHLRKTAVLTRSSRYGRKPLFWAKMFTGLSFSVGSTVLMYPFFLIPVFAFYGTGGFQAQLQLFQPNDVWLLTAGEMFLILTGLSLVTALLHGAVAMVLGERLKSNMIPMAVMVGFLLFSALFNVPEQYRILSQIWDYVPANLLAHWGAFSDSLVPIAGHYLREWQAAPVVYLAAAAALVGVCRRVYGRYQAEKSVDGKLCHGAEGR